MHTFLNIGLNANDGSGTVHAPEHALHVLRLLGVQVAKSAVVASDSEPTLVVQLRDHAELYHLEQDLAQLSRILDQDCVAVLFADHSGALIGPKAKDWGVFNPYYFFLLDGERASPIDLTQGATDPLAEASEQDTIG